MEFETFDCNRCGASLTQVNEDTYKCQYCGKVYHAKDAAESTKSFQEMFDATKREHINNLRRNLYEATNAMFISSKDVEACADELKHEIPDDFLATFFKIAAGHDDKAICKFVRKIDVKKHYDEIDHILNFLIRSLQPAYMLDVGNLIERAYKNTDLVEYEKHATALSIEQEKVKKGIYEVTLPREAFIAYSSKDMDKVTELVEVLESQGIECFVAARNLRHGKGAVENYNKALEDAMDHCKCFVFVSSLNSRSTGCDAVRIEIPHIQKIDFANAPAGQRNNYALVPHEFKKPRVEYRIEESNGFNVADKITNEFFEGYERVYSPEEVAVRVFKQITAQAEKKVKYCRSCGEEHDLEAKFCSKCANSIFVDSPKLVDHSAPVIPGTAAQGNGVSVESESIAFAGADALVKRGFTNLALGEFEDADATFEKALDANSKNAHAYLGKLMVNLRIKNEEELIAYPRPFNDNKYFKYALHWADANLQRKLNGYIDRINDRIESDRKDSILKQACDIMVGDDILVYQNAIKLLESISPWKESKERIAECYRRIEAIELKNEHERMDQLYADACDLMQENDIQCYKEAISKFCTIPNWKDSKEKIEECNRAIEDIENQNEQLRQTKIYNRAIALMDLQGITTRQRLMKHEEALNLLESIRGFEDFDVEAKIGECTSKIESLEKELEAIRALEEKKRAERRKKNLIIRSACAFVLVCAVAFTYIFASFILPDTTYSEAVALMETGDYNGAINLFNTLDGFKDSEELIVQCREQIKVVNYNNAVALMNEGKYLDAIALFESLGGYKDSAELLDVCLNVENEASYNEAISLMNAGKYALALEKFNSLGGYKDASAMAKSCQTAINDASYREAMELYNKGKFEEAMAAFSALGSFSNSIYMYELCRDEIYAAKYASALEYMNSGEYTKAYNIFAELSDYKDSASLMDQCYGYTALVFELNGEGTAYTVTGYNGDRSSIVVPPFYNDLPVVSIAGYAFNGSTSLRSVVIPDSVTKISAYAFYDCTALRSVTLHERVEQIEMSAFYNCHSLESLTLPFIGASSSENESSYIGYIFGAYSYGENASVLPSSLREIVILGGCVANYSFYNCTEIKSVTLPEGVTRIGNYAFQYCYALESVNIPESMISIGEYAFQSCRALKSVTFPEGLTAIAYAAFNDCTSIKSITIPDKITEIASSAFSGCESITSLTIGSGVETIGEYAFSNCTALREITFPETLSHISAYAFMSCSSLKDVTVPVGVKSVGCGVFDECNALESITLPFVGSDMVSPSYTNFGYIFGVEYYSSHSYSIPESLKTVVITSGTSIGESAFYQCQYITSLTLPDSINGIAKSALYGCNSLSELTLPFVGASRDATSYSYFGYIFGASSYYDNSNYVPTSLTKVVITDCDKIADYAFQGCGNLTDVEIKNGVESIGQYAFSECYEMRRVTLPRSLKSIGDNAFVNNYNLTTVTFVGSDEEWGQVSIADTWLDYAGSYTVSGVPSLSIIPACNGDDHEYIVTLEAVAPTCEESGLTEGSYCTVCDVTIVAQETIEALGHNIVQYDAYTATICTDESWDAYEACDHEGCTYSTKVTIAGTDHVLVEHEGKLVNCESPVDEIGYDAYVTCENCEYTTYKETHGGHILVSHDALAPTCESIGWDAYEECERCDYSTYSEIEKAGHYYDGDNCCTSCGDIFKFTISNNDGTYTITGFNHNDTDIVIPSSYNGVAITAIGSHAFYSNKNITSVVIPDSIQTIGQEAFAYCSNLESVTIGSGIETLSYHAFNYSESITTVYISDLAAWCTATFDGQNSNPMFNGAALYLNGSLVEDLVIPTDAEKISAHAFCGCTSIKSVTVPDTVSSIGIGAFRGCISIGSMTLPFVGDSMYGSYRFISYIFGSSSSSYNDESYGYVPASLETVVVTGGESIPDYAFYACTNIKSITIPETVTTIGDAAFCGCESLTEFTIPNNVQTIESEAFKKCLSITSFVLPESVTSIGGYAFNGCSGITDFVVPASVTNIGNNVFYGCTSLESITLPFVGSSPYNTSYTYFGYIFGASYSSSQHSDYGYIPETLKKVIITGCEGFTTISSYAFYQCDNLTEIVLPEGITYIDSMAFAYCASLEKINIPAGAGVISNALEGCYALVDIKVPASALDYISKSTLKNIVITGEGAISAAAFNGCATIESITICDGVTAIGSEAFSGCTGIKSIVIPDSVTSIGESAFIGCYALESVTLPFVGHLKSATEASAETLLGYIFDRSTAGGKNVKITQYYSEESSKNYYVPRSLKSVTITGGSLLYGALSACYNIDIEIGNGVQYIDSEAFVGYDDDYFTLDGVAKYYGDVLLSVIDKSVTSCTIAEGTRIIASNAFKNCTALAEIVIPDGVIAIGSNAFDGCELLREVVIPNSVISIGKSAFIGCIALESISLPFTGATPNDPTNNFFGYIFGAGSSSYNGEYVSYALPLLKSVALTGGYDVPENAFYECGEITSITIAEGTEAIGNYAFSTCSKLASVVLPETLKSIGYNSFFGCAFAEIQLPYGLERIDAYAFADCANLQSIVVPDGVTSIGGGAFTHCSALESITLPFVGMTNAPEYIGTDTLFGHIFGTDSYAGTTQIYQYYSDSYGCNFYIPSGLTSVTITGGKVLYGAFSNCSMLTSITIGDSVDSLGTKAFNGCSGLTDVVLGDGIVTIGDDTFSSCENLVNITLGDKLTMIGERAFSNCAKLETINIPESIESIANTAFEGCESLVYNEKEGASYLGNSENAYAVLVKVADLTITECVIDENVRLILEGAFDGCTSLVSVTIPEGVTAIGDNAFRGCTSLESVVIPNTVVRIGENAFYGCSKLTEITIGTGVTFIGKNAFKGCSALKSVVFSDINGWACYEEVTFVEGDEMLPEYISDPSDAARELTRNYADWYWMKSKASVEEE